jgi:hypothetical protein
MSDPFTTQNIDNLRARPLAGSGYEIAFDSANEGFYHQIYINGRLVDWTENPTHRSFFLADLASSCRLAVLAVDHEHLRTDFSAVCGEVLSPPPWIFRTLAVRWPWQGPGDRVALLGDHATGQMDPTPLLVRDVWPAWTDRLGWQEGLSGPPIPGQDEDVAMGFGLGAFGAGPFGLDSDVITLEAALEEEGLHHLVLRRIFADGQYTDGPPMTFLSYPPPAPPARLEATSYDAPSSVLTLQLDRG